MQIKTFSKLVGALAYLFGKVKASEDSGHVVIMSFWLGKYWVLAEAHLTKRAKDVACTCGAKKAPAFMNVPHLKDCPAYSPRH